ncbi:DeoR/GlpR family DNA-binding transcription regulator [Sediminitomix flava]|uniref:DeoR family transcriptional regulator n=1 Tax=Sediminitomix flava TaxID=379075 RepID=A0A315Z9E7_SEDFL|nr:DeoR/GlpR family DNA-binding transcription regulator [Sediminitomix flava]PWJ42185.1 DeoR family transcriptional regulator [Sediminitomix flava]
MLKDERHTFILNEIKKNNRVLSSELSLSLGVSEDTIRRDLRELSDVGKIRRVHGGAVQHQEAEGNTVSNYIPFSYEDREVYGKNAKQLIADKAVSLINDDMVILIDGGTTNLEIVKRLPLELKATFITNCLPVAIALANYRFVDVHYLGGKVLPNAQVTVGYPLLKELSDIQADICFMGTRSIDLKRGITDIDREEVQVKYEMSCSAKKVVAVASSDKLNSSQPFVAVPLSNIHMLITELEPTDISLLPFAEANVSVI